MARITEHGLPFAVEMRRLDASAAFADGDPAGWRAAHWRSRGVPATPEAIRHLWVQSLRFVRSRHIRLPLRTHHLQLGRG